MDPVDNTPALPLVDPASQSLFEAAYARLLPRMRKLEGQSLAPVTLDISLLTATVRGAAKNVMTLRDAIAALPGTDVSCVDELEDAARALLHANMVHQSAIKPPVALVELGETAAALRTRLHTDVKALVGRGLVVDDALKSFRGTVGYRVIAMDLILLAGVLDSAWRLIAGNTAIKRAELTEANVLADSLVAAVGERDQAPARIAEAQEIRLLAYNFLLERYDAARRAVTYLRWPEGDADTYAPSPYTGRGNGNHKKSEAAERAAAEKVAAAQPKAAAPVIAPEDDPFMA